MENNVRREIEKCKKSPYYLVMNYFKNPETIIQGKSEDEFNKYFADIQEEYYNIMIKTARRYE